MDRKTRTKAPQRSVTQEGLGEAVLTVTVRDGQATEAINKLRSALSSLSSFSTKQGDAASSIGTAIKASTDQATASVARLAESYKRVQSEQQAAISNARALAQTQQTAAREFLSRGVTPLTTTPAAQRQQQNTAAREAIQERRAQNRASQTAGGSGLLSFFRRQEQLQQELRDDAEVQLQRAAAQARRAESFEQRLTQSRQRSARATETATAAENTRRRADLQGRISSGLIGGAFPLLFGQGPGAALGGLAGGVAGGGAFGFGASLVGTGLGASFDALIARSKELAEALRDPITSFDQLKAASVLSSRGLETYIDALIKTGQTAKAEQLIRADLTQNLNPTTFDALSQANDELARSFSDVQEKLSALVAGPAIAFLQWLDDIVDRLPISGPGGAAPGQLPTAAQGRETARRGTAGQLIGGGLLVAAGLLTTLALPGAGAVPGAGLAAAGVGAIGAGVAAGGTAARAAGERVPEDLERQRSTAGIQKQIEAIQARRVALQKQLVGFTSDENSAAAQIAQGQNIVLAAQKAILEAKKAYISLPLDASADEEARGFQALKDAIAAGRIELEKFIAANNNQARILKRTTDLRERTTGFTPAARQGAELADAAARARADYDKAKAATAVATGRDAIAAAEAVENKLGQAWRSAAQSLREYNAEQSIAAQRQAEINADTLAGLNQSISNIGSLSSAAPGPERDALAIQLQTQERVSEAKREQVRLQNELNRLLETGTQAEIDNAAAQVEQAKAKGRLASAQGGLQLQEFNERRQKDLTTAVENSFAKAKEAAEQFKQAGQKLAQAAENVKSAAEGIDNAKLGAFEFLRSSEQDRLLEKARSAVGQVEAFEPLSSKASDQEVLRAGSAAQSVLDAEKNYAKATQELISANKEQITAASNLQSALETYSGLTKELSGVISILTQKDWNVQVNVAADGTASIYGDVVNGAL